MSPGYIYVLGEIACDFAFRLPPRERHRLAAACRVLASQPHREGDYITRDRNGRVLQNLLIDDWVITYWADHAVKEVRVAEIVQV
ncbi:MAG: hypothetical protein ABIR80_10340 [Opitutaceae bacterium]